MRLLYANVAYRTTDTRGRNAHIGQFIHQAVALGHEVWTWPGNEHPEVRSLPRNRLARWLTMIRMDVLYVRLQGTLPGVSRYALPPYRQAIGSPLIVWEFNTVPEFQKIVGQSEAAVTRNILAFQKFGLGCDLAICVSDQLAEYVQEKLGIRRVVTIPNGSDPVLFRRDIPIPKEVGIEPGYLNVVWIGSAELSWHNFDLMGQTADWLRMQPGGSCVAFHLIGNLPGGSADISPNIRYYGPQSYTSLPAYLAGMDVGLCLYHPGPSDYGSPLKLFDYLACGLAVVSTYQPQVSEILGQLEAIDLLVPPDDPQALGQALLRLAANRDRVISLGKRGRQLVVEKYNWKGLIGEIFKEIEAVREEKKLQKAYSQVGKRTAALKDLRR